ncbi:hypothetical protein C7212DRAFT_319946 [Tuber magnatum]|uniref:Uncharacterized protein n=1 Tax=Tuber magnatum TaxID=42249 RepID=A0A317SS08_9PEZI|nr:hypothetical protein C7212DRAFT_319946 [Tuber magnatum]
MNLFRRKTNPPPPSQPLGKHPQDTQRPHLTEAALIIDNLLDPTLTNQNVFTLVQILINYYAKTFLKPKDPINQKITDVTTKFLDDHIKTRIEYATRRGQYNAVRTSVDTGRTSWPEMAAALSYETLRDLSNVERFFRLKESLGRIAAVEGLIQARYKALLGVNGIQTTQIGKMVAELMRVRAGLGYDICLAAELSVKIREIVIRDLMLGNHCKMV